MRAGCCPRCPAPEGTSNGHRPRSCSAQQPAWSTPWCALNSGGSHRVKVQSISDEALLFGRSETLRSREGAQEQHLSLGWDWHQGGTLPHSRPRALPHPLQAPGMRGQLALSLQRLCHISVTIKAGGGKQPKQPKAPGRSPAEPSHKQLARFNLQHLTRKELQ